MAASLYISSRHSDILWLNPSRSLYIANTQKLFPNNSYKHGTPWSKCAGGQFVLRSVGNNPEFVSGVWYVGRHARNCKGVMCRATNTNYIAAVYRGTKVYIKREDLPVEFYFCAGEAGYMAQQEEQEAGDRLLWGSRCFKGVGGREAEVGVCLLLFLIDGVCQHGDNHMIQV